jgi:hypothetical protein
METCGRQEQGQRTWVHHGRWPETEQGNDMLRVTNSHTSQPFFRIHLSPVPNTSCPGADLLFSKEHDYHRETPDSLESPSSWTPTTYIPDHDSYLTGSREHL